LACQFRAYSSQADSQAFEYTGGYPFTFADQAEQEMFRPDDVHP